jgi:DNA-directed RNA polymerase specialized sigma24 family protein
MAGRRILPEAFIIEEIRSWTRGRLAGRRPWLVRRAFSIALPPDLMSSSSESQGRSSGSGRHDGPSKDLWQKAVDGDRDAFEEALAPMRDTLLRAAHREIQLYRSTGRLRTDALTPEELAGETLILAFDHRDRFRPDQMSLRGWLIGLLHRRTRRIAMHENNYDDRKAISLDEEIPPGPGTNSVEESMYEFFMPMDAELYEDIIPGSMPDDVEIDTAADGREVDRLSDEELEYLEDASINDDVAARIVMFHDEFELTLPEVAQILEQSLKDTMQYLQKGRFHLRQHIGSTEDLAPDRDTDSYTNEHFK